ncbi:diguanylate cyclase [Kangiella sp. HZ709]|nr:diguanylate cyclase [Kangiella sp. HZ709]
MSVSSVLAKPSIEEALDEIRALNPTNPEQAYNKIQQLKSLLPEFDSNEQKARLFLYSGYYYSLKLDYESSVVEFKKILEMDNLGAKSRMAAYNLLSQTELNLQNYNQAFEYLYSAIAILEDNPNIETSFNFYHSAANLFQNIKAWPEAFKYSELAMKIANDKEDQKDQCYAKAQKSSILWNQNNEVDLTQDIYADLDYCKDIGANLVLANLHKTLGKNLLYKKKYREAKLNLELANNFLEQTPYLPEEVDVLLYLAKIDFENRAFDLSSIKLKDIIKKTQELPLSAIRQQALYLQAQVSSNQGNESNAIKLYEQAYKQNQAIQKDLASRNLAYQQVKHSQLENEVQVKILDQENQLLKLNSEVEKKSKQLYQLFSVGAAFLIGLILLLTFKFKKQKERYQELSRKDGLTGIFSRRYVLQRAEDLHESATRNSDKYSLVAFDLDYFKSINDRYGHAIGDWVLKQVAEKVTAEIREQDIFGRLGGEEFIVVLPNTAKEHAEVFARRCLESFKSISHSSFKEQFAITASFGVASYPQLTSLEELLQSADDAMYKAKQMGRNQVFSFT